MLYEGSQSNRPVNPWPTAFQKGVAACLEVGFTGVPDVPSTPHATRRVPGPHERSRTDRRRVCPSMQVTLLAASAALNLRALHADNHDMSRVWSPGGGGTGGTVTCASSPSLALLSARRVSRSKRKKLAPPFRVRYH